MESTAPDSAGIEPLDLLTARLSERRRFLPNKLRTAGFPLSGRATFQEIGPMATTPVQAPVIYGFIIQCGDATAANVDLGGGNSSFSFAEVQVLHTAGAPQGIPSGVVVTASATGPWPNSGPMNLIDHHPETNWSSGTIYWPGPTAPVKQTTWVQFDYRPVGGMGFVPAAFRIQARNDQYYYQAPVSIGAWISYDPNLADSSWERVGFYGDPTVAPGNLVWAAPTIGGAGEPEGAVMEFPVSLPVAPPAPPPLPPLHTTIKAQLDAMVASQNLAIAAIQVAGAQAVTALTTMAKATSTMQAATAQAVAGIEAELATETP